MDPVRQSKDQPQPVRSSISSHSNLHPSQAQSWPRYPQRVPAPFESAFLAVRGFLKVSDGGSDTAFNIVDKYGDCIYATTNYGQTPFGEVVSKLIKEHTFWKIWIRRSRLYAAIPLRRWDGRPVSDSDALAYISFFQKQQGGGKTRGPRQADQAVPDPVTRVGHPQSHFDPSRYIVKKMQPSSAINAKAMQANRGGPLKSMLSKHIRNSRWLQPKHIPVSTNPQEQLAPMPVCKEKEKGPVLTVYEVPSAASSSTSVILNNENQAFLPHQRTSRAIYDKRSHMPSSLGKHSKNTLRMFLCF